MGRLNESVDDFKHDLTASQIGMQFFTDSNY
jgi:hypothetical protein